ncbi:MAG: Kazal-type serine protease inhibitor domain-containing protein [Thermoanaerobaculia bacterium]
MKTRSLLILLFFALVLVAVVTAPAMAKVSACTTSDDCGVKALCGRPTGACTQAGTCVSRPTACTNTFIPVCGCNGQTYDNECQAGLAGVSVAALGPCEALACVNNRSCPSGFSCRSAAGACGGVGVCAPMPADCSAFMYQSICGCDGNTYNNVCLTHQAGTSVDFQGACPGEKCQTTQDCNYEDLYCVQRGNGCHGKGRCEIKPEVCYELYAPVCGCDGLIYANSCFAAQAGVGVANTGDTCR